MIFFQKKIEKRGRKLVDYDSQRHNAQSIQASANSAKKKDEAKAAKARDQLEEAKRTYELLNSELHDELPALYDSRVLFLVNNLQTYFAAEQVFHQETSKVSFWTVGFFLVSSSSTSLLYFLFVRIYLDDLTSHLLAGNDYTASNILGGDD